MQVLVEFYGIPRLRAGRATLELHWGAELKTITLADVLRDLANQLPAFARHCLEDNALGKGYIANLNGHRFVSDPATPISDGASLLILSADAGG